LKHPRRCWILRNSKPPKNVNEELGIAKQFESLYKLVEDSLARGDSYFFRDDYASALDAYNYAKKLQDGYNELNWKLSPQTDTGRVWRVDSMRVVAKFNTLGFRIENARKSLIKEFKIRQRDFEVFSEAKVWGQALRNIERMQELLPATATDLDILQKELNLDENPRDYVQREFERCMSEISRL